MVSLLGNSWPRNSPVDWLGIRGRRRRLLTPPIFSSIPLSSIHFAIHLFYEKYIVFGLKIPSLVTFFFIEDSFIEFSSYFLLEV